MLTARERGAFFRTARVTVTVHNDEQPTMYIDGRPSVVNEDVLTVARVRKAKGEGVSAIAKALGVSRAPCTATSARAPETDARPP